MADKQYGHLVRAVLAQHWAINRDSLTWAAIVEIVAMREAGQFFSLEEIDARLAAAAARNGPRGTQGKPSTTLVGVVPIHGVIAPRSSLMASSGGTSADAISADFRAMLADDDIAGIVFDVDSPGGVVAGIEELATEIREARGAKPMVAIANHEANSAAYYIASQADEVVATPSGQVGSIGVFTAHDDLTEAMAQKGIKRNVISAGKYKAEGVLGTGLTDEALAYTQGQIDDLYGMFVNAVAKARGIKAADVRNGYGEGRVVLAKRALDLGMIDGIETFEQTVARVARGKVTNRALVGSTQRAAVARVVVAEAVTDPGAPDPEADEDEDEVTDQPAPIETPEADPATEPGPPANAPDAGDPAPPSSRKLALDLYQTAAEGGYHLPH